jgi:steroid 5-alpha reductase family enzyme
MIRLFFILGIPFLTLMLSFLISTKNNELDFFINVISLIFGLQLTGFIPSFYLKSEKYYDLFGGISFIFSIFLMLFLKIRITNDLSTREIILASCVLLWTIRLSFFLFQRVKRVGKDVRFDNLKFSFSKFLLAWMTQGLWVFICLFPILIVFSSPTNDEIIYLAFGGLIYLVGMVIEIIADYQKTIHNKLNNKKRKFISSGLWSRSRHPNYFGEFLIWTGITIICFPVFSGFKYLALITPIFIYFLLNHISGVNLLEERAKEKWGNNPEYVKYLKTTPKFFPKIF